MRPARFHQLLVSAAKSAPGVTRVEPVPVAEDGRSKRPYLLAVEAGGKTTRWQVTATSLPGEKYSEPEPEPKLGQKPTVLLDGKDLPDGPAGADPGSVEGALIAAVLKADTRENGQGAIAAVDRYSTRKNSPEVGHGATFEFHDGSRIFLNRC